MLTGWYMKHWWNQSIRCIFGRNNLANRISVFYYIYFNASPMCGWENLAELMDNHLNLPMFFTLHASTHYHQTIQYCVGNSVYFLNNNNYIFLICRHLVACWCMLLATINTINMNWSITNDGSYWMVYIFLMNIFNCMLLVLHVMSQRRPNGFFCTFNALSLSNIGCESDGNDMKATGGVAAFAHLCRMLFIRFLLLILKMKFVWNVEHERFTLSVSLIRIQVKPLD